MRSRDLIEGDAVVDGRERLMHVDDGIWGQETLGGGWIRCSWFAVPGGEGTWRRSARRCGRGSDHRGLFSQKEPKTQGEQQGWGSGYGGYGLCRFLPSVSASCCHGNQTTYRHLDKIAFHSSSPKYLHFTTQRKRPSESSREYAKEEGNFR